MSDLYALYQHRASVRKYKPLPLKEGDLDKLLFAAQRAPTDATAQMYSILRITDAELRKQIAHLTGDQEHILRAAEFFLLLADVHRLRQLVEHRGGSWGYWPRTAAHFATVDAVLAGSALATMAESLGYGICWIGGVLNGIEEIGELCALPEGVFPVAGLCVGVPEETPAPRPRLPRELVVHENQYRAGAEFDEAYQAMRAITRSGDWYPVLERYFTQGGIMEQREGRYQQMVAEQGFDPDLPAAKVQELHGQGVQAQSLGGLIEQAFVLGYRGVQFHREGYVWLEAETEAYRGEGRPGEALTEAVLEGKAMDKGM